MPCRPIVTSSRPQDHRLRRSSSDLGRPVTSADANGRTADLHHRRRTDRRQISPTPSMTTPCSPRSAPSCSGTGCCSCATRTSTRAEHVAFARRFGELEDHPGRRQRPGASGPGADLQGPRTSPADRYENAWHTDATWREAPPMGCVLRCVEMPAGRRRHHVGEHGRRPTSGCRKRSSDRSPTCAPATASRRASAPPCRCDKRHALKAITRTPSTRWCAPIPKPARRCCSSTPSPPTSAITTRRRTCVSARTSPRAPSCCAT